MFARRSHGSALCVVGVTTALLLAGCGGGESSDDTQGSQTGGGENSAARVGLPNESGFVGISETDAEPQQGGTLTVGIYLEAGGLDPVKATSYGTSAGMETASIFDVLMRYDTASADYVPWMAKSLEHNDDFTSWTLTLRDGINFTDGTPLNADAVVFSFERARQGRYAKLVSQVSKLETPDDLTVVFHLKEPWSRFPWLLSIGPGRVASPTAVKKWGEDFGAHPVGAGPFVFDHFSPGEELVVTANDDYWGEGPYLDKIRFVPLVGDQARLDSLKTRGLQVAYMRTADVIVSARQAGYGGFVTLSNSGRALAINNADSRPGSDRRVRKAIAYAINIKQYNQRVFDGKGLTQKELFAKTSSWATQARATPYDVDKAKSLLEQARADGFDGKITLVTSSSRTQQDAALALQAQLNVVGFDATIDSVPDAGALYGRILDGDYDVGFYGISAPDAAPWPKLFALLSSDGSQNRMQYSNPKMDGLLDELHDATSEEGKQQALNEIQKLWTETVPLVPLAAIPNFITWGDDVHGIVPTALFVVLFSQTWIS